jgi:NADH-quinone oxidoreductase subunit H
MSMMLAYEAPLLCVLLAVAMMTGKSLGGTVEFSLAEVVRCQNLQGQFGFNPAMIPALIAYLMFLPGTMGVVPFDIPEAETEIIEGPLLEYGGPPLALYHLASALKTFVVLGLGVAMFFPGTIGGGMIPNLLWFLLKCFVLMVVSLTLVKVSTGRFRVDQAFWFYIKYPTVLSLISLGLVWFL